MIYFTLYMSNGSSQRTFVRKRLTPYITEITFKGKKLRVQVNPKSKEHRFKSGLSHSLDTLGDLFNNLWRVLQNPTVPPIPSTSNTPRALEDKKRGEVYTFSKSNMIEKEIKIPGYINLKEDRVEVVVFFHKGYDESKVHYTKTFHVFAK